MKRLVFLAIAVTVSLRVPIALASDVPTEAEVKEQLALAGQQYLDRLRDYQYVAENRAINRGNGNEDSTHLECKHRDGCGMILIRPDASSGRPMELYVSGEKYSFQCSKRDESSSWVLVKLEHPLPPITSKTYGSGANLRIGMTPHRLGKNYLPEWLGAPEFKIGPIQPLRRDNRELLRIEFSCPPLEQGNPTSSGHFIVDPAKYWIITESTLIETWPQSTLTTVAKCEFREIDSLPLIFRKEIDRTSTLKGQEGGQLQLIDVTYERKQVPLEEFRLSAFGLPEPEGVTWPKPSKRYWWLIGGGVGLVVVSAFLFVRTRRGKPLSVS